MGHTTKNKRFRLTFNHLLRWIIFAVVVCFSINYLSNPRSTPTSSSILGDATQDPSVTFSQLAVYLTPEQQAQLNKISQNPLLNQAIKVAVNASGDWPAFIDQKVIEIKKTFVTAIYQKVIKSIDDSKKH